MKDYLKKFGSRKFLLSLLSVILGALTMFGVPDNIVKLVSSIGMIVIPTIVYIVSESKLDYNGMKKIVESTDAILDTIHTGINNDEVITGDYEDLNDDDLSDEDLNDDDLSDEDLTDDKDLTDDEKKKTTDLDDEITDNVTK